MEHAWLAHTRWNKLGLLSWLWWMVDVSGFQSILWKLIWSVVISIRALLLQSKMYCTIAYWLKYIVLINCSHKTSSPHKNSRWNSSVNKEVLKSPHYAEETTFPTDLTTYCAKGIGSTEHLQFLELQKTDCFWQRQRQKQHMASGYRVAGLIRAGPMAYCACPISIHPCNTSHLSNSKLARTSRHKLSVKCNKYNTTMVPAGSRKLRDQLMSTNPLFHKQQKVSLFPPCLSHQGPNAHLNCPAKSSCSSSSTKSICLPVVPFIS